MKMEENIPSNILQGTKHSTNYSPHLDFVTENYFRTQSKAEMVRDILIGAKQEDACQEYFDREAQTRTWCRETEQER